MERKVEKMRVQHASMIGTLSIAIAAGIVGIALMGQPTARASSAAAEPEKTSVARTPWGAPDLEGIWGVGYIFTPLERAKEHAGKEFLTDEEVAALEKEHTARTSGDGTAGRARGERGSVADVEGAYNQAFSAFGKHERIIRTKRTSLIVDPPDGKIPQLTPEGEKRAAELRRINTSEFGPAGRADDPEERGRDGDRRQRL